MSSPSNHVVVVPAAAKAVYQDMVHRSARWRTYVQTLPGTSSQAPLFVEDLFYALYASEVQLNGAVHPSLHRSFAVFAGLMPMPDFTRLRRETVGDAIASAMAVRRLAAELLPAIGDDGTRPEGARGHRLSDLFAWATVGRFGRRRPTEETDRPGMLRILRRALEEAGSDDRLRRAWGIEPGVRSVHALDDVWELVDGVRQLPGFDQLTDALTEMMATLQRAGRGRGRRRRGTGPRFEQLLGWTRGRDVDRIVPEEWVRLLDDDMAMLFHEAYEHGRLVQEHYGTQRPDRPGPLVVCLDVSRSMNAGAAGGRERFVWAKGIGLALMDVARRTERSFLGICFSSEDEVALFEVGPGEHRPRVAIELARCDFDGGTHFQAPLRRAITYLERVGHGARGAGGDAATTHIRRGSGHIVFITDGEAALPPPFVRYFTEARRRLGFQLITTFIDGGQKELADMSDRVFHVQGDRIVSWEQTGAGLARVLGMSR